MNERELNVNQTFARIVSNGKRSDAERTQRISWLNVPTPLHPLPI